MSIRFALTIKIITYVSAFSLSLSLAEVFSSVAKMNVLIDKERQLISHLELVLNISRSRNTVSQAKIHKLSRKLACVDEANRAIKKSWTESESPYAGFQLLKRVHEDWQEVTQSRYDSNPIKTNFLDDNLKSMSDVMNQWRNWPDESDVKGATIGLVRIGHVYDMFPVPEWFSDNVHCPPETSTPTHGQSNYAIFRLSSLMAENCLKLSSDWEQDTLRKIRMLYSCPNTLLSTRPGERTKETKQYLFSVEDFMFVARTALEHELHGEAKRWLVLVKTLECKNEQLYKSIIHEYLSLNEKVSYEDGRLNTRLHEPDTMQDDYMKLCRESIQSNTGVVPTSNRCYWTYAWPYVRYNTEDLHMSPDVVLYHDVITDHEIDYLTTMALDRMKPSVLPVNSRTQNRTNFLRVSQTAWLCDSTVVLGRLSRRVGDITKLDTGQTEVDTPAEPFQVVNYGLGGMYTPHQDSVKLSRAKGTENTPSLQHAGDRLATWMYYLSDVTAGGATVFPALNLSVTPIKGSAVFWYNLHEDGTADNRMIHAACPVILGNKWVANKWIRETAQTFKKKCRVWGQNVPG